MAKIDFKTVDDYIAAQTTEVQRALEQVRSTLRKALPGAEEVISYKIPAFRLHGRIVVYFAGWKEHYSLYPGTGRLTEKLKDELSRYKISKGTIRFELADPVPVKLIAEIAKQRAKEVTGKENGRTKSQAEVRKRRAAKRRSRASA